jgi:type IV secretory pathway TrbF-like protein
MSNLVNQSMNKYRIDWMECKSKKGFFKKQSVTVYGEDAVETVMDTVAAGSQLVEVIPVFGE